MARPIACRNAMADSCVPSANLLRKHYDRIFAHYELAAEVELATPERERWIIQTESLYDATPACTSSSPTRRRPRPSAGMAIKTLVG